jgi:hypothetical protein
VRRPLIFRGLRHGSGSVGLRGFALLLSCVIAAGDGGLRASQEPAPQGAASDSAPLSADQLDALVAPIALYPDNLLAQCLVASTYPVDVVDAQQWLARNPNLKGEELANAVEKQDWDPSIQALVQVPDALKRMSEDIRWTTQLGDAFLAQQNDVMEAVQRLRVKAKDAGKLESSDQLKVETTTADDKYVIEIESSDPEVIYVPAYSPVVIWGPLYYPYPPIYYPPYYGGAWLGFGLGIAIGIGISNGWACHWGSHNTININNNNRYVNHYNERNNIGRGGNNTWQHNPKQRGGTPYRDSATANRYGGSTRQGDFNRGGMDSGSRVGSRDVSPSNRSGTAFGGSPQSGSSTRSMSSRGSSSMGGMRGGGFRGGGRR